MKKPNHEIIANIISIILFILIVIGVSILVIKDVEETVEASSYTVLHQEAQNELNLYNQIVENEYEGLIYYSESRFNYNNLYLPTKEVNPESGKAGLCGLQNSTDNNLWEQDQLCEEYMIERYGSWKTAWEFHEKKGWW